MMARRAGMRRGGREAEGEGLLAAAVAVPDNFRFKPETQFALGRWQRCSDG